jgi:hypothetical protein
MKKGGLFKKSQERFHVAAIILLNWYHKVESLIKLMDKIKAKYVGNVANTEGYVC